MTEKTPHLRIVVEFHPGADPAAVEHIADDIRRECEGQWLPYGPVAVTVESQEGEHLRSIR